MVTLWHWHTEPFLIGTLLLVGWIYALCVGPYRDKLHPGSPFPTAAAWWFGAGLLVLYLAVGSPLDALGENFLLSAHMLQHHLLQYVAPLFLVLGIPGWLADCVLRRSSKLLKLWRFLVHPVTGGALFTLFFVGWHFPVLYEAALTSKPIHILEHITMFAPAFLLWWAFVSKSKEAPMASFGGQIIYAAALAVTQIPLFAYLVFSTEVHYPTYEFAPRIFALTPLEDQILAGVIMKTTGMFVSLIILSIAFYRWYQTTEAATRQAQQDAE
ncbi:MAG: cytochrome c oxidase assembly protein [Verrucomicrobiota bacterium]|nr:cytochrome c oxidase assembly protein [Verrucomicrobiota bacterium]